MKWIVYKTEKRNYKVMFLIRVMMDFTKQRVF